MNPALGTKVALLAVLRIGLALACAAPRIDAQAMHVASVGAARRAVTEGDLDCALVIYASVLAAHPADRDARLGRAQVLVWSTRYVEAEADYRKLLAADPGDVQVATGLALTLVRQRRWTEAEERLRTLLGERPRELDARLVLGDLLLHTARPVEAESEYERAVEIDRLDPRGNLGRARALAAWGRTDEARAADEATARFLSSRIASHPEDCDARVAFATVCLRTDRIETALAEYERVWRRRPGSSEAEIGRARAELRLGSVDDARRHVRSLLFGHPNCAEAHGLQGDLLMRVGQYAEAEQAYARAAELDPWSADYPLGIARSRTARSDFDGATSAYADALALDPSNSDIRDVMARLGTMHAHGRFRLDLGYRFDQWTGARDDWDQETAHLAWRARPDLELGVGFDAYQRFGFDDVQISTDCTWRIDDAWTVSGAYTYGPDADVVAHDIVDAEVAWHSGASTTTLLRLRHEMFPGDVRTDIVSPGLELRFGPKDSLLGRFYFVNNSETGDGQAGSLQYERCPEGPLRTRLGIAYGSEAFIADTVFQSVRQSDVLTLSAGASWFCSKRTCLSLSYDYEDHDATADKQGLALGFSVEF